MEFSHQSNLALQRVETCFEEVRAKARVRAGPAGAAGATALSHVEIALEDLEKCMHQLVGSLRQDFQSLKGETAPLMVPAAVHREERGKVRGERDGAKTSHNVHPAPPASPSRSITNARPAPRETTRGVPSVLPFVLGDALSCGLYLTLDALIESVAAEQAHLYLKVQSQDVLHPVVSVYHEAVPEAERNPAKVSSKAGALGDVFSSGIALNLEGSHYLERGRAADQMPQRTPPVRSMLAFPLLQASMEGRVLGVVQLLNKRRCDGFSDCDESTVAQSKALAYLVRRYDEACTAWTFSKDVKTRFKGLVRKEGATGASTDGVPEYIASLRPVQKVFRTKTSGNFLRYSQVLSRSAVPVQTKATLVEIDAYMREIERCWKKSTDEWVIMEQSQNSVTAEASKRKRRLKQVEEKLGALEQEKDQFRSAYSKVKGELETLIANPHPPAGQGGPGRRRSSGWTMRSRSSTLRGSRHVPTLPAI